MQLDYFSHLVNAAQAAGVARLMRSLYASDIADPGFSDSWLERQARLAPFHGALVDAEVAVASLADFCKRNSMDASTSPLFEAIEHKDLYFAEVERGRVVECADLTPAAIYNAQAKAHVLHWRGWEVTVGPLVEMADAYGLPVFDKPLLLVSPAGETFRFEHGGEPAARARGAYALMTGRAYDGDDGLPQDARHFYDH